MDSTSFGVSDDSYYDDVDDDINNDDNAVNVKNISYIDILPISGV